jgi:hypothetical protein
MKKISYGIVSLLVFFGSAQIGFSQAPTFSSVVVAAGNGSAVVTFDQNVTSDVAGTQPLLAAQFSVAISASSAGGTVSAGAVTLSGVTHAIGQSSATISFTISGVADGSEVLTVKAANATSIYSTTGTVTPMAGTETTTGNLRDLLAPSFTATAPAASSFRNNTLVSFTLSETLAAGSITWTRTGGTADPGSPRVQALAGTELNAGPKTNITLTNDPALVSGAIYTVTFNGTDAAGNAATPVNRTNVAFDTALPIFTATAPASNAFRNSAAVSYTLSENLASGSITWTQTGGTADPGSPRVQALAGTELTAGTKTNITLTNNPALVNGAIYTVDFNGTDLAGNTATAVTNNNITFDNTSPSFTGTAPASSSFVTTTSVSYTLSEDLASGSITWTRTGGTADPGSPRVQALAGTELNAGTNTNITLTNDPALVSGTTYTVTFNGADFAGNAATPVNRTNVTFDATPPSFTSTAPASNTFRNSAAVSYTLSENLASGSITWTQTGGTADPGSPRVQALAGTELTAGTKTNITLTNNPALVNGAIYTVDFNGTDPAGNTATAVTNTNITLDTTPPSFTGTAPTSSSLVNTTSVSYTLSKNIASGSITWTRTGGTADPGSPRIQALTGTELTSGAKTSITLTNNPTLVSGAIYTITFNGIDQAGNAATAVSNTNVAFDNIPPAFTATAPASNAFRNTTAVSYTLSENLVSGSITWTRTGGTADPGSPRVQALTGAELTAGTKTNITLSNNPALVSGSIYTITFNGSDQAGNAATAVSNTNVTFDTTPPAAPAIVTVTTTGGFVRATYWNGSNSGVDLGINIPNDASLVNGIVTIEARVSTGAFATIASSSSATITAANTTKTMSIVAANITSITGYAQGAILQFRARLTDAAGNGPSANTAGGTSLTVDTVQPTLSTSTYNANGNQRETMVLTFNEALDQTSGIPVLGSPGFTVNQGAIINAAITGFTGTGITLQSDLNGQWATSVNITYTKSSNATGNYVRDLAGNEWATITFPPGSFAAPVLASSMVLNPNGAAAETIVFTFDQALNTSTVPSAVTGLTVNSAPVAGTYSNVGNTVTLTSAFNGQWSGSALVSYSGGNLAGSTGSAVASFTSEPILIGALSLTSNNSTLNTSVAKEGDIVTLSFTANGPLSAAPAVTIGGLAPVTAVILDPILKPNDYTATVTTTGAVPAGPIAFSIVADEASSRTTTITNSIPGSAVTFDQISPVITPVSIASNNPNTSFARIGDVVSVSFTSSEALFGTPAVTIGGQTASVSNIGLNYTASVTIDNSYATGNLGISISLQDLAGNAATANATTNATAVVVDITPPVVASIVSTSAIKGFGTQAIAANSVSFLVTFTETNLPLTGIDPTDFTVQKDASISYTSPVVITGSGSTRTVTINGISGTGRISLGLTDNNSILDAASNPLAGAADGSLPAAYSGTQYYTIVLPEPSASVTNFVSSANTSSVTVTWNDAVTPATQATHYLVRIRRQIDAFAIPTFVDNTHDGLDHTDIVFTDGTLASYVAYESTLPTGTVTFTGLSSGTAYNVEVYPLTYTANYPTPSSGNWDYRFTSPLTGNATTTTAANGTVSLVSSAASISSLETELSGASAPQVNATQHFRFTIKDDGATNSVDDADFKFSTIVIREGTGSANSISDWTQAIASAELSDGVNTPVSVTTSAVTTSPNTITFSVNPATVGFIADDASKTYTLRIALKPSLGGTLPSNIDGKNFEFRIDQGSFATFYDNGNNKASSTLAAVSLESGNANNQVAVIASQLVYNTEPQPQIGVGIRFSLVPLSGRPVVYALDPNNNLDLGFTQTGTIDTPTTNLNPSPTSAPFSGGQLSLSNLQLNAAGTSGIRVQASGVTAATSTNVTAVISNKTTIAAGAAAEPATISSLATALSGAILPQQNAIQNFDFTITDDLAADITTFIDNDGLPTLLTQISINQGTGNDPVLVDWRKVIAGAELRTSGVLVGSSVSINATDILFSGIANSVVADPGYIADGGSRTYQLRIFLRTSVDATIADDIDNKDFVFSLDQSTVSIGSANTTSTLATSITDSGDGKNAITVLPTRFAFTTAAYNTTSIGQNYDSPLSPLPLVKVQDPNGNRDTNYAGSPSVAAASPATYTLANTALVNTTGTISFNAGFQVTSSGNGPSGGSTTFTVSDGTLTSGVSIPVTFSYSASSDIIRQTVGFAYTSDILYATPENQVTAITNSTGTEIERFSLRDGAGASDADGTPTVLNEIVLNINNWQNVRKLALFDGASKLTELDVPTTIVRSGPNIGNITFTGFTFSAADNSNKDLSVKASFNALNVVDNQIITVRIVSVKAATTASSQFSNLTPSGIQSAPTNQENKIEVVATVIDFTTLPTNVSVYAPFAITVEARDANINRDVDYNGTITSFSTTPGPAAFVTTNDPSGAFANGVYNFPANFQFTSGDNASTTLVLAAGAASTANSVNATAISSASSTFNASITVITSFDSRLAGDPTYIYQPDITYIDYQATNIANTSTSYEIARFLVRDGDPTTPYAAGTLRDLDGAATILQDFDVELYTGLAKLPIRRIGIYVGGSEVAELAPAALVSGKSTTTFTGVNITAPDEQDVAVSIRVSFLNNATDVVDNDAITLRISSATAGNGSNFLTTAGFIGGVSGGLQTPSTTSGGALANKIEVNATRLDFTTQPPNLIAGINQPFAPPTIEARDATGILDLDYDQNNPNQNYQGALLTSTANLSLRRYNFEKGKLQFPSITNNADLTGSLYYTTVGDGTITVTANGVLSQTISSTTNGSISCNPINVIHTTATGIQKGTNGVVFSNNLRGGTKNAVIFGVTFSAANNYVTANEPLLNGFSIAFNNPFETLKTTVLENFRVFESTSGNYVGANNITALGGTITKTQSDTLVSLGAAQTTRNRLQISFASPRKLNDLSNPLSYFLVVDVNSTANNSTPKMLPFLVDEGYQKKTDGYIAVTSGSSTARVIGQQYKFASTNPTKLVSSLPKNGQLNVGISQNKVSLIFDVPVATLDGLAYLYERSTNTLIATLKATSGQYIPVAAGADPRPAISTVVNDTIDFAIPSTVVLKRDEVYYLTIAKGDFNTQTNKGLGISDDNFNLFGGISYKGTLYFKTESPNAPLMTATDPTKYYVSSNSASFNCTFDQRGMAYYMVVNANDPVPTNAQIRGASYSGTVNKRGSFKINQVTPSYQSTAFDVDWLDSNGNHPSGTFEVWVCAENDAPTPVQTRSAYGSRESKFALVDPLATRANTPPTLTLTIPDANGRPYVNAPTINICGNSSVFVTDPIIISEGAKNDFTATGQKDFSVLLPTGFQFDITNTPSVLLTGTDFIGLPTVTYFNNTVLNIRFVNSGTSSFDNIIISNLKIIASSADLTGNIVRYAGNGLLDVIGNGKVLATITSTTATPQAFTNTYNTLNSFDSAPISIANTITVVPDNFIDDQRPGSIQLIPTLAKNDYGPSFFSGSGVSDDILSLSGVSLDNPFDITMTHTDINGCISSKTDQYNIYDHTIAIKSLAQLDPTNNNKFLNKIAISPSVFKNPLPTLYNDLAGYSLVSLFVDIPSNLPRAQIIQDGSGQTIWKNILAQLPGSGNPISTTIGNYNNYLVNYAPILNAKANGAPQDPNDYFYAITPAPKSNPYYTGGSLGIIQFTGVYQSDADQEIFIPRRQQLEVFIPAKPIIEVNNPSFLDRSTGKSIPIFCEAGGDILINGFPAAVAGSSTGYFTLSSADGKSIKNYPDPGPGFTDKAFVDNGNGTATLKPYLLAGPVNNRTNIGITNGFQDIIITYTYQDNNSPAIGSGSLTIRIEPNPIANFNMAADIKNINTPTANAYCENRDITFDPKNSTIGGSGKIVAYDWDFNDPNSLNPTSKAASPTRKFANTGKYTPSLIVTSSYGCASTSAFNNLSIGVIPIVNFGFTGTSENDLFKFKSTTSVFPGTVSDGIAKYDWDFGDSNKKTETSKETSDNKYANPNDGRSINRSYTVKLTVTSKLGCVDSKAQDLIVLPYDNLVSGTSTYNFESDQKWQSLPITGSLWQNGTPDVTPISPDDTNNKVWKTGLTGAYSKDNRSFLYSPAFKLSALKKPIVSFNSWFELSGDDAVVLEYSIDNLNILDKDKKWFALGYFDPLLVASGLNWYTAQSLTTKPGNQATGDYGWSKMSISNIEKTTAEWLDSRHTLSSNSNGPTPSGNDNVVFRFSFSSAINSAVSTQKGFAMDQFRVGERTRLVVVESFSNLGNSANEKDESNTLKSLTELSKTNGGFNQGDILNINYHLAFPNKDPFNLDNPDDPSARALFYNVSSSPRSRVDGVDGSKPNSPLFSTWKNYFNLQQLKLPTATIDLTGTKPNTDGSISIPVKVKAQENLDTTSILHVGIVERSIAFSNLSTAATALIEANNTTQLNSEFVLKKMLPNAAGTKFRTALKMNESKDFGTFSWTPDPAKLYPSANDLYAFAFVQNYKTREIYQSAVVAVGNDPTVVTGIGELTAEDVSIFPNPANKEFTIELPSVTTQKVEYQLFDQVGKIIQTGSINEGQRSKTINSEDFSNGIYIIQLNSGADNVIRKKVMVFKE